MEFGKGQFGRDFVKFIAGMVCSGNFKFYDGELVNRKFFGLELVNFSPCVGLRDA